VPPAGTLEAAAGDAYLHITANETIEGVEWPSGAEPDAPVLVCDTSSDFLSRPVPVARYGLLYAGAQKNAGPAGVTVAIVREDLLAGIPDGLPQMLDYRTYAEHGSMFNTPPVFAIYIVALVTRWLRDEVGGLAAQEARNREKASLLYGRIDASGGLYRGHAAPDSRSMMNVTWRLPHARARRAVRRRGRRRGPGGAEGAPLRRRHPRLDLQRDAARGRASASPSSWTTSPAATAEDRGRRPGPR
jgi:phosphoserine aminotransferase